MQDEKTGQRKKKGAFLLARGSGLEPLSSLKKTIMTLTGSIQQVLFVRAPKAR